MRMRLGRPDLGAYSGRFDVPAADGDFSSTSLGVSGLLLDDGESAVMVDGYFSRPPLWKVLLRPLEPDGGSPRSRASPSTCRLSGEREDPWSGM